MTAKQPKRRQPRSSQRRAWQTHELETSRAESPGESPNQLGVIVAHHGVAVDVRLDRDAGGRGDRGGGDRGGGDRGDAPSKQVRAVKVRRRSGHVVGDRVEVVGERLVRHERRTQLLRRDAMGNVHTVAANLDVLGIVVAPVPPSPTGFIDRALIAAEAADLAPFLVVNKADLPEAAQLAESIRQTWLEGPGAIVVPVFYVSAATRAGLDSLREYFGQGHRGAFVGTSGVGKSSLVNALLPQISLPVGEINELSGLGRHTTTTSTLHTLPGGGELIDTPGFRDFGLVDINVVDLSRHFPGFTALLAPQRCRFNDCRHRAEPDCVIKTAVADGRLARARWERYLELLAEIES